MQLVTLSGIQFNVIKFPSNEGVLGTTYAIVWAGGGHNEINSA